VTLACLTPKGREAIERQLDIARRCGTIWCAGAVATPSHREAGIDVLFHRADALVAVAEVKWRPNLTLEQLHGFGSYLVTFEKINGLRIAGRDLCVSSLLIVGLVDAIVYWPIADGDGNWLPSMTIQKTTTQATVNGGVATRANAYLTLTHMRIAVRVGDAPVEPAPPLTADDIVW